jgi:hypothetical protein
MYIDTNSFFNYVPHFGAFWLLLIVLAALLADRHGRSALFWGLMTFFFGPLALVVLVLLVL